MGLDRPALSSYFDSVQFTSSALNHCTKKDVEHAIRNVIRYKADYRPDVDLYIGPAQSGDLLEILVNTAHDESEVFHADKLRAQLAKQLDMRGNT